MLPALACVSALAGAEVPAGRGPFACAELPPTAAGFELALAGAPAEVVGNVPELAVAACATVPDALVIAGALAADGGKTIGPATFASLQPMAFAAQASDTKHHATDSLIARPPALRVEVRAPAPHPKSLRSGKMGLCRMPRANRPPRASSPFKQPKKS
jgi:hypothetical protein